MAADPGQPVFPDQLRRFDRNLIAEGRSLAPRVREPVPFCWFCDVATGKRSKEHIFPKWLLEHYGAVNEMVHPHRISTALGGTIASERGARPLRAHYNGEVCASCNNGWMASLEARTKPILTRIPRRGRITDDEAVVLARWFAKVAVNLNVSQPYRLLVEAASRHALATFGSMLHGAGPATMILAVLYGSMSVTFTLWFTLWARARWSHQGPLLQRAARGSYATYFLHPLVLTCIMVALASFAIVPELKFLLVSIVAVPVCFLVGYALTRLPGFSKVL